MRNLITLIGLTTLASCQSWTFTEAPLAEILSQNHVCSDTLVIRSQALSAEQVNQACDQLSRQETRFHQLFNTQSSPVKDDNNHNMRANVYQSRDDYQRYVTAHFNVPNDNGGMYLEGIPNRPGNQAEFVAYAKNGQIWNLSHEYVHYLDGRFNLYGDFCTTLHDSHSAPEYCPQPTPAYPHLVWWSEGLAEYVAKVHDNPEAIKIAKTKAYTLSELFNTSYENNGGSDRVYRWGYLATRFMMEKHRTKVDEILTHTRSGDYLGYQSLVAQWGTSLDEEFSLWLSTL